ncbi:Bug family tripartite tricarboxylate transporter substrate binding protein [Azohydromonas caseinilytica]|uniref:Tripartite tricarboxylate transporter substrate binding protein n=1 Tax=Azohydromonas caseinilytica TaxID=2728836 RepID=A0A848FHR3_9BURK|nr:tripartite tricarboxylate transporter substrate binding protein [Azohydromonas caseinilytica]NML18686.1 tripartite tricarboxylate transporter substrate binding protein [Azohydromonas caseinilytica]
MKPITWIVPFPPGGVTDLVSRAVAAALGRQLGQPVIVENHPGVAGSLGTELAARLPADGYTLLYISTGPMAVNPALYRQLRYDPLRDFIPVHGLLQSSALLVVDAASPYRTLADFLEAARRRPGQLNVGSSAPGTSTHLAGMLLARESGVKFLQVPYKGSAAALQDLLGGRLDAVFDYVLPLKPHLDAGRLRPLVTLGRRRLALLPEVPAIAEAGWRGAEATSWSGIGVRTGTPEAVMRKLAAALHVVLTDPEVMSPFIATGEIPLLEMNEAAFRTFIAAEQRKWGEVVRQAGLVGE